MSQTARGKRGIFQRIENAQQVLPLSEHNLRGARAGGFRGRRD
jgi:hypothetical protein